MRAWTFRQNASPLQVRHKNFCHGVALLSGREDSGITLIPHELWESRHFILILCVYRSQSQWRQTKSQANLLPVSVLPSVSVV